MDQPTEAQGSVAELKLYRARAEAFRKYTTPVLADNLALRLMHRDRDPTDDRRICLACANLKGDYCNARGASPVKGFQPCKTVLWRCDWFKAKG